MKILLLSSFVFVGANLLPGCVQRDFNSSTESASTAAPVTKIDLATYDSKKIDTSSLRITQNLNDAARAFLQKNNLIKPGEESSDGSIVTKWAIVRVVKYGNIDLLIMNPMLSYRGTPPEPQDRFEVIALIKNTFHLIEEVVSIPSELVVGIGEWVNFDSSGNAVLPSSLYYTKLRSPDNVAFVKAMLTRLHYAGFSAGLTLTGGKESFDPTPARKWRVINAKYDLRRGSTVEIEDVYPGQLDQDFDGYYKGCVGKVAPWAAAVRRVYLNDKWIDLVTKPVVPRAGAGVF